MLWVRVRVFEIYRFDKGYKKLVVKKSTFNIKNIKKLLVFKMRRANFCLKNI